VLAIRWGLGVEYSAKGRFEGDPMPIGREQDRPDGREGREGSGTRVSDPYGTRSGRGTTGAAGVEQDSPDPAEALDYYTGEVGALVVEQLQSRIARGYFGDMLKDVAELGTSGQEDVGDSQFGDATGDYDAYGQGPARGLRGRENVDGYEQDRLGNANDGDAAADPIHQVVAGVTMLGLGSRHELFQKARQQDVDALLIFVVYVERNARNGMVYNNTKLRLFDVAQDKQLAGTRLMNNYKIQVAREKDEDDETVKLEVENVFKVADEHFRCIEVPGQIQPSHAAGHASKLAARTYENPLRALAEMRYWHSRKLLSDDQLVKSFTGIVGAEGGTKLAQGSADERKAVVEKWLPGGESERTTRTQTRAETSVR
jgi:hypothetical protein